MQFKSMLKLIRRWSHLSSWMILTGKMLWFCTSLLLLLVTVAMCNNSFVESLQLLFFPNVNKHISYIHIYHLTFKKYLIRLTFRLP